MNHCLKIKIIQNERDNLKRKIMQKQNKYYFSKLRGNNTKKFEKIRK